MFVNVWGGEGVHRGRLGVMAWCRKKGGIMWWRRVVAWWKVSHCGWPNSRTPISHFKFTLSKFLAFHISPFRCDDATVGDDLSYSNLSYFFRSARNVVALSMRHMTTHSPGGWISTYLEREYIDQRCPNKINNFGYDIGFSVKSVST